MSNCDCDHPTCLHSTMLANYAKTNAGTYTVVCSSCHHNLHVVIWVFCCCCCFVLFVSFLQRTTELFSACRTYSAICCPRLTNQVFNYWRCHFRSRCRCSHTPYHICYIIARMLTTDTRLLTSWCSYPSDF